MPTDRPKSILMRPDEIINLKTAADYAKKDHSTIRRWCKRFGIARQAGRNSPLDISAVGLEMVLYADYEALELLRAGERNHPDVVRYFDHLGIAP